MRAANGERRVGSGRRECERAGAGLFLRRGHGQGADRRAAEAEGRGEEAGAGGRGAKERRARGSRVVQGGQGGGRRRSVQGVHEEANGRLHQEVSQRDDGQTQGQEQERPEPSAAERHHAHRLLRLEHHRRTHCRAVSRSPLQARHQHPREGRTQTAAAVQKATAAAKARSEKDRQRHECEYTGSTSSSDHRLHARPDQRRNGHLTTYI